MRVYSYGELFLWQSGSLAFASAQQVYQCMGKRFLLFFMFAVEEAHYIDVFVNAIVTGHLDTVVYRVLRITSIF